MLKWANKNQNNFNIFNVAFFNKIKKNTCRYHHQNLDDMIYSSWDIEQNILKLVILGHFLPFYPLKTPKIKILKNEKICWRYHHFTQVYQKSQSYDAQFLRCRVRQTKFLVILDCFLPFYPPMDLANQNFENHVTNVYHKWKSYNIWFLRYGAWQTAFFAILYCFLHFTPTLPNNPKN